MMIRINGPVLRAGPFALVLWLGLGSPAAGQVRPRPDSIRPDTTQRPDSTRVVSDTVIPPRIIVKHARGMDAGFGAATWVWEREDLMREGALTLADLLQQIPSVVAFRAGLVLQPEVASAFAQTRGRVQLYLDGYELDPLLESTHDFARIELANLERVRVERRLDITRIELSSLEPTDGRPHSRVEAGVGEPDTNLFRGVFLTPRLLLGPFGFAIERIDSDGQRRSEPVEDFNGWAKWALIRGSFGLQGEIRQSRVDRQEGSPWPGEGTRRDLIVRARAQLIPGLVAEAFGGRSTFKLDTTTVEYPDTADIDLPDAEVTQFGVRGSYDSPMGWLQATARFRSNDALPQRQLDLEGGFRLARVGSVGGHFAQAAWGDTNVGSFNVRASSASFRGLTAFAEMASGDRAGPSARFLEADSILVNNRTATRLGAGFARWGGHVNAALVKLETDSMQSFGLPWDSTDVAFRDANVTGWEIEWRVPLLLKGLSTFGTATNWPSGTVPIYLPNQHWRAGLEYHNTPLRSGNLELLGRVEMRRRGELIAPTRNNTTRAWETSVLPVADQFDAYLQIRIIDVRIFLRAENMANKEILELPGRPVRGTRIMYGVKWSFWN